MSDNVNHPSHYAEGWSNGAEVIDITENLNFNRGNAVKYIARAGKKDPSKEMEDLQKAEFYLKREIVRFAKDNWGDGVSEWEVSIGVSPTASDDLSNVLRTVPLEHVWAPDDEDELPASVVNLDEEWHKEHVWRDTDGDLWKWDVAYARWSWSERGIPLWRTTFHSTPGSINGPYVIVEPVKPREWESLDDVPHDVDVYDLGGRVWYKRDGYAERYYKFGKRPIDRATECGMGPFTEVLEEAEPREWRTLADAPINIKVLSAAGYEWQHDSGRGWVRPDISWLPDDPNWRVSYGPWTEVL